MSTNVPGLSFPRILKSEVIKFRTLRSTWITYAVALLVGIGLGLMASGFGGNDFHSRGDEAGPFDPVGFTLAGLMLAQLAMGVVGVLFATGEYATGSIRASIAAVPQRTPVLVAKAVVLGVVTAVVAAVMALVAFFAGQAILTSWGLDVTLGHEGAVRALSGAVLYLTCVALMGLGIGFALRNTGGAIATLFGIVLVLPLLMNALPQSWQDKVARFLPLNIVDKLTTTTPTDMSHSLSNGWGAIVLVLYAVGLLAIGLAVLKRRDV